MSVKAETQSKTKKLKQQLEQRIFNQNVDYFFGRQLTGPFRGNDINQRFRCLRLQVSNRMKKSIFWLILSVLENKIRLLPAKILSTIKRNKINILDFLMNTVNHASKQ